MGLRMPNEIKVKYDYAPDYKKIPATGAWGGLSPNAEVIINFFVEFQSKPDHLAIQVDESGTVKEKVIKDEEVSYTRELLVGVVMRHDIARSVGKFLINYADKAEEAISQKIEAELKSRAEDKS